MLKKLPLFLFLFSTHSYLFAQQRTIDFSAATGTSAGAPATQTIAQSSSNWVFSVSGSNATSYKAIYDGEDYLEVSTQGAANAYVSNVSIKKADGKPFNFKSIYLYVLGTRQQIKVAALRAGSAVSGLSQIYDLYKDTNPDVTFAPSNWNNIDEIRITNNGASAENGTGYINDIALDFDNFTYELAPVVVTSAATLVTSTSVTFNGALTDASFNTINERGFVYATTTSPTINNSKRAVSGVGTGNFSYEEATLLASTTYFYRAYATVGVNTTYGQQQSFTTQQPLPVVLVDYSARIEEKFVKLEWSTTTEITNNRFEILRSKNGKDFELIGTVDGNGTSSVRNKYIFYDKLPLNGTNYYRLVQFDNDGTSTKFSIKQVRFLQSDQNFIYPNPAVTEATISFAPGTSLIELTDLNGKVIHKLNIPLIATQTKIPLNELPSGTYFVRMKIQGESVVKKLIKL